MNPTKPTQYVYLSDDDKLRLIAEQSCFVKFRSLKQTAWCFRCEQVFDGYSVRVFLHPFGILCLECGGPGCTSTPDTWCARPRGEVGRLAMEKWKAEAKNRKDSKHQGPATSSAGG